MTFSTWTCLRCVQELATILGPQNPTQRSCDCSVVVLMYLYLCLQNDSGRGLKWGDEVEYIIVKLDHAAGPAHQARGGHVGKYSEATR